MAIFFSKSKKMQNIFQTGTKKQNEKFIRKIFFSDFQEKWKNNSYILSHSQQKQDSKAKYLV